MIKIDYRPNLCSWGKVVVLIITIFAVLGCAENREPPRPLQPVTQNEIDAQLLLSASDMKREAKALTRGKLTPDQSSELFTIFTGIDVAVFNLDRLSKAYEEGALRDKAKVLEALAFAGKRIRMLDDFVLETTGTRLKKRAIKRVR